MEALPLKATFAPGDDLVVELRGGGSARGTLVHLGYAVAEAEASGGRIRFPPQREGGYAVLVRAAGGETAATALDVLADPLARPRYGFVSHFDAARDAAPVADFARRLHLNAVQFYDWMYRHADLVPTDERYDDPLGRPMSRATVERLVAALREAGTLSLGYAAVYAVGREAVDEWRDAGLVRADGAPWTLGEDFLWLVDPGDRRWARHLCDELRHAAEELGFAGFHLDQYGWPKRALRADGGHVDLASAFVGLLAHVRAAVPGARLIFNNVNDFPTWATARAPQDAVYIEVWPPHERLGHLADLVAKARLLGRGKPVVLAAYLSVFASAPEEEALAAARLTMATIFSHGGHHLLNGEDGAVLTDPYYPRHHRPGAAAVDVLRRWYDHAVALGDVLFDPLAVDVTKSWALGVNEEVRIEAPVPLSVDPEPGSLWVRVVETGRGTVVHLIDLSDQTDLRWDAPKRPPKTLAGVRVAVLAPARSPQAFLFADPEGEPGGRLLAPERREGYDVVELPPLSVWGTVLVRRD